MKKVIFISSFYILLCSFYNEHSKENVLMNREYENNIEGILESPNENLIKILNAYKTVEFPESRKIISYYSFGNEPRINIIGYENPYILEFSTDIENIKGYKALINCNVKMKDGNYSQKKMLAIMYFNKKIKQWSLFDIREVIDAEKEYDTAKKDVDNGEFYTAKKYVYRNLAYWSLMAGKINEARKYLEIAKKEAKIENDNTFDSSIVDMVLNAL